MAGVFAGMGRAASNEQEPEPATPKRGPLRRPKHFNAFYSLVNDIYVGVFATIFSSARRMYLSSVRR